MAAGFPLPEEITGAAPFSVKVADFVVCVLPMKIGRQVVKGYAAGFLSVSSCLLDLPDET